MEETKFVKLKDPIIKSKWLKALRSGRYSQGRAGLRKVESFTANYCCLGVLLEELTTEELGLHSKGWKKSVGFSSYDYFEYTSENFEESMLNKGALPVVVVRNLFDVDESDTNEYGEVVSPVTDLISLNDTARWSFSQIADWIEKNL